MKIKIEKILKKEINTKYGPKTMVSVKDAHTDTWVSGFENAIMDSWQEGQEIEVETEVKGKYINFVFPKGTPPSQTVSVSPRMDSIEKKLDKIIALLTGEGLDPHNAMVEEPPVPEDEPF